MEQINSIEQFRELVVYDYKRALLGAELRRVVSLSGNARHITARNDVAQVELARYLTDHDEVFASGIDLTLQLARGSININEFFENYYASSSDNYSLSTTSNLPKALGMAMAMNMGANGHNVVMCSIDGCTTNDGRFFEAISMSVQHKLPMCIVVWNTTDERTVSTLKRQLSGFSMVSKNGNALQVQTVRGGDFAAICHTFEQQISVARSRQCPSVTFVESADDDVQSMALWMSERKIAESQQLTEMRNDIRQKVEAAYKKAYYGSLVKMAPMKEQRRRINVFDELSKGTENIIVIDDEICPVDRAVGMACQGKYPLVDATAESVIQANWNNETLLVRTTDYRISKLLTLSPEIDIVLPATINQENEIVRQLCAQRAAAVVLPAFSFDDNITHDIKIGSAYIETVGNFATLLCFGRNVTPTLDAAGLLRQNDINCDVVSLASLQPFDTEHIIEKSLERTQRLMIIDNEKGHSAAVYILGKLALRGALHNISDKIEIIAPRNDCESIEATEIVSAVKRLSL